MTLGDSLLAIVSICTFLSYFPQVVKLLKTKKSEDISSLSWVLWLISSNAYTVYAFVVSRDLMLIFETCLESGFCLTILILSIKYRNNG